MALKRAKLRGRKPASARHVGLFRRIDNGLQPLRRGLERSAAAHLFAIGLAVFTFIQLSVDLMDRRSERDDRRESQIERSWQHLLARAGGKTGKGTAVNTLVRNNQPIVNVDLSCENVGGWKEGHCITPPTFEAMDLEQDIREEWMDSILLDVLPEIVVGFRFFAVNTMPIFTGSIIDNSNLSGAVLTNKNFSGVEISGSNLHKVLMIENVEGLKLYRNDLSFSTIVFPNTISIHGGNISGMNMEFRYNGIKPDDLFQKAKPDVLSTFASTPWYWADRPPKTATAGSVFKPGFFLALIDADVIAICDPSYRYKQTWLSYLSEAWPFGKDVIVDTGENRPRFKHADIAEIYRTGRTCPQMTHKDAVATYPNAYKK